MLPRSNTEFLYRSRRYRLMRPIISRDEIGDPRYGAMLLRYFGTDPSRNTSRNQSHRTFQDIGRAAKTQHKLYCHEASHLYSKSEPTVQNQLQHELTKNNGPRLIILKQLGIRLSTDSDMDLWQVFSKNDVLCTEHLEQNSDDLKRITDLYMTNLGIDYVAFLHDLLPYGPTWVNL